MIARTLLSAAACALAAVAQSSWALEIPHSCGEDAHIQCASFDANQMYRVATMPGRMVMLEFEPGETIIDDGAGIGDASAWHLSANERSLMFKPGAPHPDTNLMIVTNRRRYILSLVNTPVGQPATWVLRFTYPDSRAKAASLDARRQAAVAAALATGQFPQSASQTGGGPLLNSAYSMRGSLDLAPTSVWDDGRFTYFRYATSRDMPKVFTVLSDGTEATANFHMEGGTIVVHETSKEFVIRYGQSVLGIRNDAYTPDDRYNASGSSIPGSARIVHEQQQQQDEATNDK
jgi:type IV secretion system protein VirB9